MKIDAKMISLVHVAKARLRLDDAAYRDVLRRAAGVESARELTPATFDLLMDEFARLGFRSDARRANLGHRAGMASPKQVHMIRKLWAEWSDSPADAKALSTWLERTVKISALRFLTPDAAGTAIVALKAMCRRKAENKKAS